MLNLKKIEIPEGVTSIGDSAFEGCTTLKKLVIPQGVTSIGNSVFEGSEKIREITLSVGITSIGEYAFCYCSSLKKVVIPENVTSIGEGAFQMCESLESIVIPDSVTSIGENAFIGVNKVVIKDIGLLSKNDKPAAVAGFATCFIEFSDKEIKKYISYIKKNTPKLKTYALDDVRLLNILLENNCLVPNMIDEYLQQADNTNNIEAKSILLSIKDDKTTDEIFDLGDEFEEPGISNKSFVVTGDLKSMTRDEFKKYVSDRGGRLVGSISGKTDYLICNDISSATKKVTEAKSIGIKIINETEFFEMFGNKY